MIETGRLAGAPYTVRQAAEDWLKHGLDGRSARTVKKNQNVLEPILTVIGTRKLRQLSAGDVRHALATGYSSAVVTMGHLALKRAIRHAEANDLVSRNVATLVDTPKGQHGAALTVADPRAGPRGPPRPAELGRSPAAGPQPRPSAVRQRVPR